MTSKLAAGIKAIPQAQPYNLSTTISTPELPARAGALPERLQDIARNYLGARRQSGVSLLEAARWLSEARQEAKHGEWAIFLEAIGLDESRARAQIRIHEEAQRDPLFADRIVNGFLSETVARELLPAPPEVREEVLSRDTPPTLQDVREAKRASTPDLPTETPADLKAAGVSLVKHGAWYQAAGYSGAMNGWTNSAMPYAQAVQEARAEIAKRQQPVTPESRDADGPWFKASKSAAHPTAHHWNVRPSVHSGHYLAACGIESATLPATGADAGLCGVCAKHADRRELVPIPTRSEVAPAAASSEAPRGSAPATDAGRVAAIRRYLDQQRQAGRIYDKATFNAAWELAHDVHDGDTWRAITHEIHTQTNGGKGAPMAETQPKISEVAPARLTCSTCGEPILNGIWGDLKECGSCYHARQQTETPPPAAPAPLPRDLAIHRPKKPVSADVSAQVAYVAKLEAYTAALEQLVIELRALLKG